jgi:hypothetical protein
MLLYLGDDFGLHRWAPTVPLSAFRSTRVEAMEAPGSRLALSLEALLKATLVHEDGHWHRVLVCK